jgi:hypothetical protein
MKFCRPIESNGLFFFLSLVGVTFCSFAPRSNAAAWSYAFPADLSFQYDDNLNLTTTNEISAYRLRIVPSVLLERETDQSHFDLNLALWIDRYYDTEGDYDRNDPRLSARYDREFSRAKVGAAAKFIRRPTIESQFEDTGQANVTDSQDKAEVSAYGQYDLDERNTLGIDGMFRDVSYDTDSLTDYQYGLLNLNWENQHSAALLLRGFVTATHLAPDDTPPQITLDTDAFLLGVGGEYAWSEQAQLDAWLGAYHAEQDGGDDTSGLQAMIAVKYQGETSNSTLTVSRTQQPSGSGSLRIQNEVRAKLAKELTERSRLGVDAYWRDSKDLFDSSDLIGDTVVLDDNAREEIRFEPWYKWWWTESLALRMSYTLRRLQRDNESDWATSNVIFLGLEYRPQPRMLR